MKRFLPLATILCCLHTSLNAQKLEYVKYRDSTTDKRTNPDYILSYGSAFVARVFTGHNMNHFNVEGGDKAENLRYAGNFQPNVGFGISYSFLTLNLSFGIADPPANKGKTNYFSFQSNLYYRKWAVDLVFKTLKGMYLKDENQIDGYPGYYINPDLRSVIVGGAIFRILNPSRFSYKAIMTQSEWQKKSAGTFLLGMEAYYGHVNGNDSIVPTGARQAHPQDGVTVLNYMKIGPGLGYAYNFVFQRHWFVAAAVWANLDVSFNTEKLEGKSHMAFTLQPNYNFRLGAGYNSKNWNINFQLQNNSFPIKGAFTDSRYSQSSANYRLSINRRLFFTKKTVKYIDAE